MKRSSTPLLGLVLLSSVGLGAAPPFAVEDQWRRVHDARAVFGGDRVTVIVGGDERRTGEAIRDWVKLLPKDRPFRLYGLADLDGVPFFVPNQSVRDNLIELVPNVPVLCDFDGELTEQLAFPAGEANVQVYFRSRKVGTVLGPASREKAAQVVALVRTASVSERR